MMVASSHVLSLINPRWKVPNGYIVLGWFLFLQEQIKDIIIIPPMLTHAAGWRLTSRVLHVCE